MSEDPLLAGLDVYLVGGAVRDSLLGYPFHDRDWVIVGTTPDVMRQRGFRQVGRDFPVFLHPTSGEEYALARTERKKGRGYTGFEVFATPEITLEQDLERRDLTINAIAQDAQGEFIDPFLGRSDLKAGILRHVGPAFTEDPLRVIRLARYYARYAHLGFSVADATQELCAAMASQGELSELAAERVWQESARALEERYPGRFFTFLADIHALAPWWRELADSALLHSACKALERTVEAGIDAPALRWAALMSAVDDAARSALAERLKLPTQWQEAARYLADSVRTLDSRPDGAALVAWAQRIDYWRRGERWHQLLPLVRLFLPGLDLIQLTQVLEEARQLSPRQWVEAGMKGPEIGKRLAAERKVLLDQAAQQLKN